MTQNVSLQSSFSESYDRKTAAVLAGAAVLYLILYAAFWPTLYSTLDEASYMGNAYVLRQGTIYADQAGVSVVTNFPAGGHQVSKYPLGMAGLLALASFVSWQFALGVNLLIHLATFAVVIAMLRQLKVSAWYALLYLFHPTAVLYSRTVMSDLASGLVIALAFCCYLRGRMAATGGLAGLSVLIRTGNILAVPVFAAASLFEKAAGKSVSPLSRLRLAATIVASALIFVGVAAYYAAVVAEGKMGKYTGSFGLSYFPSMFSGYVTTLMLLYPGFLLAPALYRGEGRWALVGLTYSCILMYSFWYYRDQGSGFIETIIVGQRYFLAVLPLLVVAYAEVLSRILSQRRVAHRVEEVAVGAVTVVLVGVAVGIHLRHARFLGTMVEVRDGLLAATTPADRIYCNAQVAKLLHPGWGQRQTRLVVNPDRDRAELAQWLAERQSERRAVLAIWVRNGREDDQREANAVNALAQGFSTLPPAIPLPPELKLRYVVISASRSVVHHREGSSRKAHERNRAK